jgi:hypothetical protein
VTFATRSGIPSRSYGSVVSSDGVRRQLDGRHRGGAAQPSADPQRDSAAIEVRNLVVDRMRQMNARHAMHAFDRMRSDPIGPHGLAFLYRDIETPGHPPRYAVQAATRLFPAGYDVLDLPRLLREMTEIGRAYQARPGFDPLRSMMNRYDEVSPRARYIGVGVSSLDGPDGAWESVRRHATSALEIPGRSFALLVDGSRLVLDRGAQYGGVGRIESSHPLDAGPGQSLRRWSWLADPDGDLAQVWSGLAELHAIVLAS